MPAQTRRLWGLDEEQEERIFEGSNGSEIVVIKGEKVKKYSDFDIQIQVRGREYKPDYTPSHPDVFKDLERKINSYSSSADRLSDIIKHVYEGESPENYVDEMRRMPFDDEIFPADVTVYLLQVMMIEQEINYGPGGKKTYYDPPRDLLMSCVRWIFSGEYDSLDDVISAGYNGRVPNKYEYDGNGIWTRPQLWDTANNPVNGDFMTADMRIRY